MFEFAAMSEHLSANQRYVELCSQLSHLLEGERDPIANMANAAALLYHQVPAVNWTGFYRWMERDETLVLGPFHGLPACIRIPAGRGVCGAAVRAGHTIIVPNVQEFPGHIACDAASAAEIVVPLVHHDRTLGVMDLDSPLKERFTDDDRAGLERFARILMDGSDWI